MNEPNNVVYYKILIQSYLHNYPDIDLLKFNTDFNQMLLKLRLNTEDFPIEGETPYYKYTLDSNGDLKVLHKTTVIYVNITINPTTYTN